MWLWWSLHDSISGINLIRDGLLSNIMHGLYSCILAPTITARRSSRKVANTSFPLSGCHCYFAAFSPSSWHQDFSMCKCFLSLCSLSLSHSLIYNICMLLTHHLFASLYLLIVAFVHSYDMVIDTIMLCVSASKSGGIDIWFDLTWLVQWYNTIAVQDKYIFRLGKWSHFIYQLTPPTSTLDLDLAKCRIKWCSWSYPCYKGQLVVLVHLRVWIVSCSYASLTWYNW